MVWRYFPTVWHPIPNIPQMRSTVTDRKEEVKEVFVCRMHTMGWYWTRNGGRHWKVPCCG